MQVNLPLRTHPVLIFIFHFFFFFLEKKYDFSERPTTLGQHFAAPRWRASEMPRRPMGYSPGTLSIYSYNQVAAFVFGPLASSSLYFVQAESQCLKTPV